MMPTWKFFDYIGSTGRNYFKEWLEDMPLGAQIEINTRLKYLAAQDKFERPYVGILNQECDGLIELRIKYSKVQYRPIACYGPNRHQVTLLAGAIEKGSSFEPKAVCKTALKRKKHIKDKGRTNEHTD